MDVRRATRRAVLTTLGPCVGVGAAQRHWDGGRGTRRGGDDGDRASEAIHHPQFLHPYPDTSRGRTGLPRRPAVAPSSRSTSFPFGSFIVRGQCSRRRRQRRGRELKLEKIITVSLCLGTSPDLLLPPSPHRLAVVLLRFPARTLGVTILVRFCLCDCLAGNHIPTLDDSTAWRRLWQKIRWMGLRGKKTVETKNKRRKKKVKEKMDRKEKPTVKLPRFQGRT